MPYNQGLDKNLFSQSVDFENTKIIVSVFSYNEGVPKLQISRQNLDSNSGDWRFSKLGRLTKEEAEKALPLIKKALEKMEPK